jgi:hypothetical protein
MYLEKTVRGRRRLTGLLVACALLALFLANASLALAQDPPASTKAQEMKMSDILRAPGKVLAESRGTKAAGLFKVKNYRVEEIALPHAQEVEIGGRRAEVSQAFRVTVEGGPFPVRALPPVIWIDDVAVGYGVESEDLTSITAVTFDSSLLREGATIYLSYGDKENKKDRTALPEKLKLNTPEGGKQ